MKLIKRLLLTVALLLVGALAALLVAYHYVQADPEFYRAYQWTSERRAEVNQQAVNKLLTIRNLAAAAQARELRGSTQPIDKPVTVTLSDEELNAFIFHNGEVFEGFREKCEQYVTDPGVFLRDGQVIFAGTVKDFGCVLSFHFAPSLDANGKLRLKLVKAMGGQLALPSGLVDGQLDRMSEALKHRLPGWRREAKMDRTGAANLNFVAAAMGQMLSDALAEVPTDAIVFLPVDGVKSYVPLQVTHIEAADHQLTMTVAPLSEAERGRLGERVKASRTAVAGVE